MTIYESPEEWGSLTIYADRETMEDEIASLKAAGGTEWSDIDISHCRRWRQVAGDIFQQMDTKYPETARLFIIGGGFYKFYPAYEDVAAQAAILVLARIQQGDSDWALDELEEYVKDNSETGDPHTSLRDWLAAGQWTGGETPAMLVEEWDDREDQEDQE